MPKLLRRRGRMPASSIAVRKRRRDVLDDDVGHRVVHSGHRSQPHRQAIVRSSRRRQRRCQRCNCGGRQRDRHRRRGTAAADDGQRCLGRRNSCRRTGLHAHRLGDLVVTGTRNRTQPTLAVFWCWNIRRSESDFHCRKRFGSPSGRLRESPAGRVTAFAWHSITVTQRHYGSSYLRSDFKI